MGRADFIKGMRPAFKGGNNTLPAAGAKNLYSQPLNTV